MQKKFLVFLFVGTGLALLGSACSNPIGFSFTTREGTSPEGEIVSEEPGAGGVTVVTQRWTQPEGQTGRVDAIFVVDTSGSMDGERTAMANAVSSFVNTLAEQDVDVCIGVMLGHITTWAGKLYSVSTTDPQRTAAENACLCVGEVSDEDLVKVFEASISNFNLDETESDGGEAGLYSFRKSILTNADGGFREDNIATGCYRNTAALVPIFVSDENEISTSPYRACGGLASGGSFDPVETASVYDPECGEAPARANHYSDYDAGTKTYTLKTEFTTAGFYAAAQTFQGPLGFFAETLGYVGDVPSGGENEYPYGYIDLTALSGGDSVDLTKADPAAQEVFNAEFSRIGEAIATRVKLLTVFDLARTACEGTIAVTRDGNSVADFTFNGNRRVSISAADAGSPGSVIQISYNVC